MPLFVASLPITVAKYSFYGLDDSWATYDLMGAAERARWVAGGVIATILTVVMVIWRAVSSRQRRRAAAVLRESEERFRNMADTAPVMIWVTDSDKLSLSLTRLGWAFRVAEGPPVIVLCQSFDLLAGPSPSG